MNDVPSPVSVSDLLERLRSRDDAVRGPAWQEAGSAGPAAVAPLVATMADPDFETARAARRALWRVVDHAGRPGADPERVEVVGALGEALEQDRNPVSVRRELLWMLSVIGDGTVVAVIAGRLLDPGLREDARCALQRIPGSEATRALREAFGRVGGDFSAALADALRARGEVVFGHPSRRLVPSRATAVGN